MDIVISFAGQLVACIGGQVGFISYKANFKELRDHVMELEGARDQINNLVYAERRKGNAIDPSVLNWLERVDGVIEEANELQEDPCLTGWSFSNLILQHQLSKKATKMTEDILELQRNGKFERVGNPVPLPLAYMLSDARGSVKLESRESIMEDIIWALTRTKLTRIGIYGLGGVGKTTIVKEIARNVKQNKLFDVVVFTNVSQTPDLGRIQGEIADMLSLNFKEETVAGRSYRLREIIKREKTILIILDDIWTRLDLEKVGIPFDDEHNGCKVLMTCRDRYVLRQMEAEKDFKLEVLSDEEAWNLFKVMAGDSLEDPSLQHLAHEVAKKCVGLPINLVVVAMSLKNKNIYEWQDALKRLESFGDGDNNDSKTSYWLNKV